MELSQLGMVVNVGGGRRLDSGELADHFLPTGDVTLNPVWVGRRSQVQVSDDGRFVVHLAAVRSSEPCFDFRVPRVTDDRDCVAFWVYEIASGRRVLGPVPLPFGAGSIAINADGSLVAVAGGYNGELAVYRTSDGELLGSVPGLPRPDDIDLSQHHLLLRHTAAVTFGPDDAIYVGSLQGPIRVVDASTLGVVRTFDAPPGSSNFNVLLTADGLLLGNGREAIVAIDTSSGATRWSADIERLNDAYGCFSLAVAPITDRLYCGSPMGILEERELETGRMVERLDPQQGPVGDLVTTTDGQELVAFAGRVPVISRWRLDGTGPVTDHIAEGHIAIDGYDPTGGMLLVMPHASLRTPGSPGLEVAVWDPMSDEVIDPLDGFLGLWAGRNLMAGVTLDGLLPGFYDVSAHATVESEEPVPDFNVENWVWMSPDGVRTYISVVEGEPGVPGRCEVWTFDGDARRRIQPTIELDHCQRIWWVSGTRDGSRVVVTTGPPTAAATTTPRERGVEPLTTVHDGRTGEQLGDPIRGVTAAGVSPDGVLVAGDQSGAIIEYDLSTLEPVGTFPGNRGEIDEFRFSADGETLVAISRNQTITIYDVDTRIQLGDPIHNDVPAWTGSLRPDGKAVATNTDRGVAVWDIDPAHLADAACQIAGRNLTRTEWDTYLGDPSDHRPTCPDHD